MCNVFGTCTGVMHDTSKLKRVFNSLEVFSKKKKNAPKLWDVVEAKRERSLLLSG